MAISQKYQLKCTKHQRSLKSTNYSNDVTPNVFIITFYHCCLKISDQGEVLTKSQLKVRSSHRTCSIKIAVLKTLAKSTKKPRLCQRLFFNKVAGVRHATLLKK